MSRGVGDGWARECSALPMHGSVLIESSHNPSSGGYASDLVTPGQAMMEHDSAPPFRVEPLRPYKRCEVGVHFFLTSSTWLETMKPRLWTSSCSPTSLTKATLL